MTAQHHLVNIVEQDSKVGILKVGDVEITADSVEKVLAELPQSLGDGLQLRALLPLLPAPYKRVVLSASYLHTRKRHKSESWTSRDHLAECLRQHRLYFRRRGVATSLDMDPAVAFGDKGVTGTANDRDVFLAFMKRIGLEDAVSPNAVAAAVMKGLRDHKVTKSMPEGVFGKLFEAMARKPGQNVDRKVFDEIAKGTPVAENGDAVYGTLCELTRKRYEMINQAITRAHAQLQVSLTLEKDGVARFALNNPFGLAIPYEGSLFRVYEVDDAHHVSHVCPTFFTITGGNDDGDPFTIHAISHGGFEALDAIERFRIGEVYIPATVEQLGRVGQFALEHCSFDVALLAEDSEQVIGSVLEGSGGAIRRLNLEEARSTRKLDKRLVFGEHGAAPATDSGNKSGDSQSGRGRPES